MSGKRVAVLGAGVMGACLALYLARRHCDVVLFDCASAPLQGASRWNEGKIHLGYLYAGDPALDTARRLLPGGLAFAPLVQDLIGARLDAVTQDDDLYLVHRDSVVAPDAIGAYFAAVSQLAREAPGARNYLVDLAHAQARSLSRDEIAAVADPDRIVAAFTAPERSVATAPLADRFVAALAAEPRITQRMNTRIDQVRIGEDACSVVGERFDWIVNALWHGRIAVDAAAGLAAAPGWSHRYRVSAFIRTAREIAAPSAVIALGPFGDMKNYNDRDFYLSWYDAGLLADSEGLAAPQPPQLDAAAKAVVLAGIERALGAILPGARAVFDNAEHIALEGGYVFAQGKGSLADRSATVHQRSRFGVRRRGRYISVDTGKYSTAPLMALELAEEIAAA